MGVYQIGAKSILEFNPLGPVPLLAVVKGCHKISPFPAGTVQIRQLRRGFCQLSIGLETTPPRNPPFDARSGFSRGMPRSFCGGQRPVDGSWAGGSCIAICIWEKKAGRLVGCHAGGVPACIHKHAYTSSDKRTPGAFSYSIIVMIQCPPHKDLQPCLRGRGLSKLFRKCAVIVILPLTPRAAS